LDADTPALRRPRYQLVAESPRWRKTVIASSPPLKSELSETKPIRSSVLTFDAWSSIFATNVADRSRLIRTGPAVAPIKSK
jgi:hypothetical protein